MECQHCLLQCERTSRCTQRRRVIRSVEPARDGIAGEADHTAAVAFHLRDQGDVDRIEVMGQLLRATPGAK